MKSINIDGRNYLYKVRYESGEGFSWYWTEFYLANQELTFKKYLFFGKNVTKLGNKLAFTIPYNIEDHNYTKEKMGKIVRESESLMRRKEEIQRGELI